jgi:hypothetical protein
MGTKRKQVLAEMPASVMMWALTDAVIENTEVLEKQFHDIRDAGVQGVAPFVRCSRYSWDDGPARKALKHISVLCKDSSLENWIGPDPRFISHLVGKGCSGLEVVLFGDRTRALQVPNTATVADGRFTVRCDLTPRHVHTLTEVAIDFRPLDLAGVYAIRDSARPAGPKDIIDVTDSTLLFFNARNRYAEAFGFFSPPDDDPWRIVAFFRCVTNHFDYSSDVQLTAYLKKLDRLKLDGVRTQMVMWDEPGFTCTYGNLAYTPAIRKEFKKKTGKQLSDVLWKLAFDAADRSHIPLRETYYRIVQYFVNDAQRRTIARAARLWGQEVRSGIHDTWHFESADMCDMNHGSLDLWRAGSVKNGGFVDLGGIDQLKGPDSAYYANLAMMCVTASSLGQLSRGKFAVNNLWTVGDDDGQGWQRTVMDHCVNVMAVFGNRWLTHIYGPVGTIGEEDRFLGSPPLPGYPNHSTWNGFPGWTQRLKDHFAVTRSKLPWTNLLLVYPVETMYAFGDTRADAVAREVFQLVLDLVDNHFHVMVVSPSALEHGQYHRGTFELGQRSFDGMVYPFADIVPASLLSLLRRWKERIVYYGGVPRLTTAGRAVSLTDEPASDRPGVLRWLERNTVARPVEAPSTAWTSITERSDGTLVTLCPARHGYHYAGRISFGGKSIDVGAQAGLVHVLFPQHGVPEVLDAL